MGSLQFKKISFTRTADSVSLDAKHNPNQISYSNTPTVTRIDLYDPSINTHENNEAKKPSVKPAPGTWGFNLFYDESIVDLAPFMTGLPVAYEKVVDKIKNLRSHLLDVVASEHESAEITVKFGSIEFVGHCTSFKVDYIDFDLTGEPLSAEVSLSFQEEPDAADVQSPDITHLITIKEGDHMTNIVKKIYGSPIYVTDVARANNLTSFRGIEAGSKLYFPPLQ